MAVSECLMEFRPRYVSKTPNETVNGWAIGHFINGEYDRALGKTPDGEVLKFASERDVRLSIEALAANGIRNKNDVIGKDRAQIVRICCEALLW